MDYFFICISVIFPKYFRYIRKKVYFYLEKNINTYFLVLFMKSTFQEVFGSSNTIKLLDFLLDNEVYDYSISDIARRAEISWTSFTQLWPRFVEQGLVIQTRTVGPAKLYMLNKKSPVVKQLLRLDWELSKQATKSLV